MANATLQSKPKNKGMSPSKAIGAVAEPVLAPMLGETQSQFFDRALRALRKSIPSINRRTIEILRLWRASPNAAELNQKASAQFPKTKYTHFGPRCVFLEHTVPSGQDRDEIVYDRKALEKLVDWANYRIDDSQTFASISEGHTPSREERLAGHQMPDVLGYSGPFYLGLLGDKDPKWAIYAEEWVHNDDLPKFEKLQRRSPEVWVAEPMEKRTLDPIAALGAETPRLDSGMNPYSRAGDDVMVMKYSASGGPSVGAVKYSADSKVEKTMREFKEGSLHSGSKKGPKVTDRKQAVAIALSQARKAGAKIPERYEAGPAVMPGPNNCFIPSAGKPKKRAKPTRYGDSTMAFTPAAPEEDKTAKLAEVLRDVILGLMPSILQEVQQRMSGEPEDETEPDAETEEATTPRGVEQENEVPDDNEGDFAPGGDEDEAKPKDDDMNTKYRGDCNAAYAAGMAAGKGRYSRRSDPAPAKPDRNLIVIQRRLEETERKLAEAEQLRKEAMRYHRLQALFPNPEDKEDLDRECVICEPMDDSMFDVYCSAISRYSKADDITQFELVGTGPEPERYSRNGKPLTAEQVSQLRTEAAGRAAKFNHDNYSKGLRTTVDEQFKEIVKERGLAV